MTSTSDFAPRFSPWLSVWLKPRDTIERILAGSPKRHVLMLAAFGGIFNILGQLIYRGLITQSLDWLNLAALVVFGAAFGIVGLYVSALLLRWTGKLLGGRASPVALRAVLAWSVVPNVVGVAICLVVLAGAKLFAANAAFAATSAEAISALRWLVAPLGLWSSIAGLLMLSRVQSFGLWRTIMNTALTYLLVPLLLALTVRTFVFQVFDIPSASMMPTLLVGDYLFVSKYAYGYSHYSLPFSPRLFSGRVLASEPQRGDVVVFRLPSDDSISYIKRVVGLPGDRIQMRDGVLYINGEPVKRERVGDFTYVENGRTLDVSRWRETLPNGRSYETFQLENNRSLFNDNFLTDTQEYKVPDGHYFVMGDNRDDSDDSRDFSRFGYIPFENLVGRAERIYWSIDRALPAGQPVLRSERLGTAVR